MYFTYPSPSNNNNNNYYYYNYTVTITVQVIISILQLIQVMTTFLSTHFKQYTVNYFTFNK